MIGERWSNHLVLAGLCALYLAARIWRLTDSCLSFDEIFSVHTAEHDWLSLYWFAALDLIHPPLFYSLLKVWIEIGGESLLWLRTFPLVFSAASLVAFILLCRELKQSTSTIAVALFLISINGTFIKYAQLVRMYSLLMCLSLFSIWLFARYFIRGKNLAALIIVNVLMIYTHYSGWLVFGSELAAILIFQRFKWRGMATMLATLIALFLPWLYILIRALQNGSELKENIGWIARPGFAELGTYTIDLIEPFYFQFSNAEAASVYMVSIPLLFIIGAAAAMYIFRLRKESSEEKRSILFLVVFSFLPIAAVLIASWILPQSIWGTRHLIIVAGPLALLAANVLVRFDNGAARIAAITLIALFAGYAFVLQAARDTPVYVWCAWERIADDIVSRIPENEKARIYTFESLAAYHLWFAERNANKVDVILIQGIEGMVNDSAYFLPRGFDDVKRGELIEINDRRAWLVFRTEKIGRESILLESLRNRGYTLCPYFPAHFGNSIVCSIEILRPPVECSR